MLDSAPQLEMHTHVAAAVHLRAAVHLLVGWHAWTCSRMCQTSSKHKVFSACQVSHPFVIRQGQQRRGVKSSRGQTKALAYPGAGASGPSAGGACSGAAAELYSC